MDTDRRTQAPRPRQRAMPTTRTALVRLAQQGDAPDRARAALGELCLMYWQPVHVFIRRSWGTTEAADLTQGFMANLLTYGVRGYDRAHDQRRSRFRSWLLGAVQNFLNNERQRRRAEKRDERRTKSLDELSTARRSAIEPRHDTSPEHAYRSRFAACLVDQAWDTTRDWYAARGQAARFDLLERFIPGDEIADLEYEPAATALGISVGGVRRAVMDLRVRYRDNLRRHVREIVACEADVDDELRFLFGRAGTQTSERN